MSLSTFPQPIILFFKRELQYILSILKSSTTDPLTKLDILRNYIFYNLLHTKRVIKAAYLANLFKGSTFIVIISFMFYFNNFSFMAWTYLCMHGSYGILWVIKYFIFPDKNFEQLMTLPSAIGGSMLLSLYYMIGYFAISNQNYLEDIYTPYNQKRILFCLLLYTSGVALMLHADYYKFKKLSSHKKEEEESKNQHENSKTNGFLITTDVFAFTRNPNYLGEAMLYTSFAMLSNSIISYLILLFVFSTVFLVNMLSKEISFQKKPNWNAYKQQSWIFFPKLHQRSSSISVMCYVVVVYMYVYWIQPCIQV